MGNDYVLYTLVLGLILLGAWAYRFRGGGKPASASRLVRRGTFALTLGLAGWVAGAGWASLLIPVVAYYGIIQGHGSYMDLATNAGKDNESWAPLLDHLLGEEDAPSFWRDFLGLALTGVAMTFPVGIVLQASGLAHWYWYALVGLLKPTGYVVGLLMNKVGQRNWEETYHEQLQMSFLKYDCNWLTKIQHTVLGEWTWGGIAVGFLALQGGQQLPHIQDAIRHVLFG